METSLQISCRILFKISFIQGSKYQNCRGISPFRHCEFIQVLWIPLIMKLSALCCPPTRKLSGTHGEGEESLKALKRPRIALSNLEPLLWMQRENFLAKSTICFIFHIFLYFYKLSITTPGTLSICFNFLLFFFLGISGIYLHFKLSWLCCLFSRGKKKISTGVGVGPDNSWYLKHKYWVYHISNINNIANIILTLGTSKSNMILILYTGINWYLEPCLN